MPLGGCCCTDTCCASTMFRDGGHGVQSLDFDVGLWTSRVLAQYAGPSGGIQNYTLCPLSECVTLMQETGPIPLTYERPIPNAYRTSYGPLSAFPGQHGDELDTIHSRSGWYVSASRDLFDFGIDLWPGSYWTRNSITPVPTGRIFVAKDMVLAPGADFLSTAGTGGSCVWGWVADTPWYKASTTRFEALWRETCPNTTVYGAWYEKNIGWSATSGWLGVVFGTLSMQSCSPVNAVLSGPILHDDEETPPYTVTASGPMCNGVPADPIIQEVGKIPGNTYIPDPGGCTIPPYYLAGSVTQ